MEENKELVNLLRVVIKEELQPVHHRLDSLERGQEELRFGQKQLEQGQKQLEQGQKLLQKDVASIKVELREIWKDILKFDRRITVVEDKIAR